MDGYMFFLFFLRYEEPYPFFQKNMGWNLQRKDKKAMSRGNMMTYHDFCHDLCHLSMGFGTTHFQTQVGGDGSWLEQWNNFMEQ